jgi:DNA polymerase I-like protein with 3'-5' exonuclease and polymerase domains
MQNIFTVTSRPSPIEVRIHPCKSEKESLAALEEAMNWPVFAYDYETTGIKPYREGHRIAYFSVSNGDISYSTAMQPNREFADALKALLTNDAIKIAHNANFERSWTQEILGYPVKNLIHDPSLMQHCLNNQKPTGLKFLTFAWYGFLGYDADADEYIQSVPDEKRTYGTNAFNRVFDAPASKMLEYNAMDSLFTFWLYEDLYKSLDKNHQRPGYEFFMELSVALYNAHREGIRLDVQLMDNTAQRIEDMMRPYIDAVMTNPLITQRWTSGHAFNPRSDTDIRTLLYGILKLDPIEFTDGDKPSVDADTLFMYKDKVPIIAPLFQIKRLGKLLGTYIRQIRAEKNNDVVRSFFNLNRVKTYRSSSSDVNQQNLPKRDKESRQIVRSLYLPKRGHKFIEYDFKAMEVSVAAAVTGDKNLIKYVTDPSTDMHRDLARKLFFVEEVDKNLRGIATKGPWTFAQFYGSYWKQTAAGVWAEIDIPNAKDIYGFNVVKHLRKCGITSYEKWEKHCEEQEYILWNEFFPGYKRWRDDTFALFQEQGYVDYVDGFRYYGPATRNEVLNGPVQGPAFHVQGWAFKEMDKFLREGGYNTRLVGQIHDSIVADADPAEEGWVDRKIHELATIKVREHWDWITVPLIMEKDSGEIDGSWADMKSCGILRGEV